MYHRLLVARLVVGDQLRPLEERFSHTGHVAVAEDAEAALDEALLHAVALRVLRREEANQRLGHRQPNGHHAFPPPPRSSGFPPPRGSSVFPPPLAGEGRVGVFRFSATIAAAASTVWATSPSRG